jgi:two-component system response regulator MprA
VVAADGGNAALQQLASTGIDAIVLDVAMAEPNGLEVCRRVRAAGDRTPILMLTARDLVDDRVAGLDAGADDYLVKPFALAELRARLRALLRRSALTSDVLSYGDLVLDLAAARVRRGSREVPLTRTEYLLLELFLRNPVGSSAMHRSSRRCGATTSACAPTACGSTWATSATNWRPAASRASPPHTCR